MSGILTIDQANVPPDHVAALVARLRRFAAIMALCPDETVGGRTVKRVAARLQAIPGADGWAGHAVVVQDAGGLGPDRCEPFDTPRVACLCYGSTGYEAMTVARTVVAALDPVDRTAGHGFTEAGCAVVDVWQVGGIAPTYDRENKAHVRVATFLVRKCQIAQVAS